MQFGRSTVNDCADGVGCLTLPTNELANVCLSDLELNDLDHVAREFIDLDVLDIVD